MSSPGYFYTPEDQEAQDALLRKQAYAQALLKQGSSDPGNTAYGGLRNAGNAILGAYLSKKADTSEKSLAQQAQQKYIQSLGRFLTGNLPSQPQTPLVPPAPPQLSNGPSAGAAPIPAQPSPSPQGAPMAANPMVSNGPWPAGAPAPMAAPQPQQPAPQNDYLQRLMATGNPALIQQFAAPLFENQLNRDNKVWENQQPLSVADRQKSDLDLQRSEALAKYNNGLPLTSAERATLGIQQGQLAVSRAALNKPVSVGFGETLVSPQTGKVVYSGGNANTTVPTDKNGQPLTGDAFLSTLPANLQSTVKAIASYRQAPLTGMAMRSPYGAQLASAVNQYNPQYDATQYGSKTKARNDFATGKNGNTVRSLNVAVQHLDQLGQLSQALGNGDVQMFNRLGQSFAAQTGNPAPTNFDAAKQLVGDEIVKAIVGAGGGVGDREQAQANISRASSPQQLDGVIQTYKGLMSGQLSGLQRQYEHTTGLKDFEDYLAPETKLELQAHAAGTNSPNIAPTPSVIPQGWTVRQK